jgi:DNA repair photolyase
MKIKEIKVKNIITKTNLPEGDFVINPYIGCMHSCKYCYARFMKRFTGHKEEWGSFIDVKINAPDLIPANTDKYRDKYITISSVTDAYLPLERKYQLTRKILEKLVPLQPHIDIITKSDLVTRDIDLFKQFDDCIVAISMSAIDDKVRKELEEFASPVERRIEALKKLHEAGIKTVLFISPLFPGISDWKEIIERTKDFVDEYWFENLNLYPSVQLEVFKFLKKNRPELVEKYKEIYTKGSRYWDEEEKLIKNFCSERGIKFKVYFHHKVKKPA